MKTDAHRRPATFVIGALVVAALTGYVVGHFRVTADVSQFLPDPEDRALSSISQQLAQSELSRTMILALEAPDRATALQAGRVFERALRTEPRVAGELAFLEAGPQPGLEAALFALYEPRRLSFLAEDEATARTRLSDAGLRDALHALHEELRGPLSPLVTRVAPRDPFLTIPSLFRRLGATRASDLRVVDGRFLARDDRTAVLFLGTRSSALDARLQAPFLAGVRAAFDRTQAEIEPPIRLDQSGVNRFSTRTAEAIEADIKRVSIVSSILLGGLLVALFRSLRFVVLAALPIGIGVLSGCAVVLALFGRIHGITLAFGASLIGVSVDYVVHLYCHHCVLEPAGGASASLATIRKPLLTGVITTLAGFLALSGSHLPGLREVACFAVVGIAAAFLTTLGFVPALIPDRVIPVEPRARLVSGVLRGFHWLRDHRAGLIALPLVALALCALGLPRARWNPDLASMGRMDPALLAEDARVQQKVAPFEQMRFVVASGPDEATALEVNDRVDARLRAAIEAGELEARRSLASLLPSPARQAAIARLARADPGLSERLRRESEAAGFTPGAFDPYLESLEAPLPEPLRFADLLATPLASLVRSHRVSLGDRVAFLTFLHGVSDPAALEARLEDLEGAMFLRQSDLFEQAQLEYQASTGRLLAWGLLAVLVLLAIRYREVRRTLVAFVPSVIAAGSTVSVLALAGRGLDLISLTALLFVVSMGVDYSVFLVDAHDESDARHVAAALTGALLACVSTVVAFGLLSISQHPVLADLGLTSAVGIATSLLLAPTALVLIAPERRREGAS